MRSFYYQGYHTKNMNKFLFHKVCLLLCLFLVTGPTATVSGVTLNWTNGDQGQVYNGPDKPTIVTFNDCVKIRSITTTHWNWGKGDKPGKISLFHEDGTPYGPWDCIGENATNGATNVYWVSRPGEVLKAGTYLVTDSNPGTWSQNDGSDNRGIATIAYEPISCLNQTENLSASPDEQVMDIPDDFTDGVTLSADMADPATLSGGANLSEKEPSIEQVGFTPLYRNINGGQNVYAILRVKNTGNRDLEEGYVTIRFISQDGTYSYRGGTGKLPIITAGEERDIALIIPTEGPIRNGAVTNTLYCTVYSLDGHINELMEGGYFESRGLISLSRENLITVSGCCKEPFTEDSIRGCGDESYQKE